MSPPAQLLRVAAAGLTFQNPIMLAAGTAAYGRELVGVMDLDLLGGLVTKAVSVEPRKGAAAPRVAEFEGGMINAVGLANPGLEAVRSHEIPWLAANVGKARVIVNVIGNAMEDFGSVVAGLDGCKGVDAFELNVSCPNVKAGGMEFGADRAVLSELIARVRRETTRPLFVKLSPTLTDIADAARVAADAGADGLTLVNTIPGLAIDVFTRRPALGFGSGGVSGPGLLPVGVLAVWKASRAVKLPIIGVGGVMHGTDAIQYMLAGATLVGVGTAALRDPRAPERIAREIREWCVSNGVLNVAELVGTLEWPS
ncbi:MAG: dihydroorotate dehydrogenase [Gemmatimonadaceae bacterium]|nr:dihydroorotate dehydrogenase [Gemmatimonadaceae bacterium]